jgi:hypothetical protein
MKETLVLGVTARAYVDFREQEMANTRHLMGNARLVIVARVGYASNGPALSVKESSLDVAMLSG